MQKDLESTQQTVLIEKNDLSIEELIAPQDNNDDDDKFASKVPFQANPWIASKHSWTETDANAIVPAPLVGENFTIHSVGGCDYLSFDNFTLYGRPEFMLDYNRYMTCLNDSKTNQVSDWISSKIRAKTGVRNELLLKTNFEYGLNMDKDLLEQICDMDAPPPSVIFAVFSTSHHLARRETIRQTWGARGKLKDSDFLLVFFVGNTKDQKINEQMKQEAMVYQDLVSTEIDEDDELFEFKQHAAVFAWLYRFCELGRFVVRTTDTSFMNVVKFQILAKQEMYSANRIYGQLLKEMLPDRHSGRPHFVSQQTWPWPRFPPFIKGPSYVISGDVVPRLLVAMRHTKYFPLQQVYFTALATLTNRVMRIGIAKFFSSFLPEKEDDCSWAQHGVIEGITSSQLMADINRDVYQAMVTKNMTCATKPDCMAYINGKCVIMNKAKERRKSRRLKRKYQQVRKTF